MILNRLLEDGIRMDFEAVILDITYSDSIESELKIKKLETSIQLASDKEVTYDPIDKYIRVADFKENHQLNNAEIMNTMGFDNEDKVEETYRIFKVMDNYLKFINFKNVYSRLSKKEDFFINFEKCLNLYRRGLGRPTWNFDKDDDVDDFENNGYYIIRWIYSCPYTKKNPKDIRELFFKNSKTQSIFSDKKIWTDFKNSIDTDELDNAMTGNTVKKKLKKYINSGMKSKDAALKIDQEWAEDTSDIFRSSVNIAKKKIDNKHDRNKPTTLIHDALSKLEQLIDQDLLQSSNVIKFSESTLETLNLNKKQNVKNSDLLRRIAEKLKNLLK